MIAFFRLFLLSLQFLTRIPVPGRYTDPIPLADYRQMVRAFPLVGLVVGLISAMVFTLTQLWWGNLLASAFAVLTIAMITGGFHLDGLADTADGIFSSRPRERMLEIMRDSRIGTQGALALIFKIILHVLVIYQIAEHKPSVIGLLIVAPVVGRALGSLLMYRQPYARESGMGNLFIGNIGASEFYTALILGAMLTFLFTGGYGVLMAAASGVFLLLYRAMIQNKLGGQTGDTVGAGIEIAELVFLLLMAH
ncbi:cobalamin synthase [Leminorella richardii]|uniref:Adenosylcobinamide-GDP ribazoletransferase n=1 Tax=Leminorella richardii TaxID=158841 RepID=A0A2X4UWX7_9GAMM|nr:adenosylcobinamide-GDP ribazoletransferase [Leminorella richardii]SQI40228.1 cobalamin synthase [Leminorella richardii]